MYADLIIQVNYVDFSYILIHRTSNNVMLNTSFEYCGSYNTAPIFLKFVLNEFKKHSNNLVHACPYTPLKQIGLHGMSFASDIPLLSIFKSYKGDYKSTFQLKDRKGKLIAFIKTYFGVTQKKSQKSNRNGNRNSKAWNFSHTTIKFY